MLALRGRSVVRRGYSVTTPVDEPYVKAEQRVVLQK